MATQIFSVRMAPDKIDIWKAYASASGQTMTSLVDHAISEYIASHQLGEKEQFVFDLRLSQLKEGRNNE